MTAMIQGYQLREILLGTTVTRADATIPQTATGNIFTVSGGRILLTGLVGLVGTVIGSTATTLAVVSTPAVGTAVTIASATAITSVESGGIITLPLTSKGALVVNTAGGGGQMPGHAPYVIPVGTLGVTTSASTTGSLSWVLTYVVLDNGASVAAA